MEIRVFIISLACLSCLVPPALGTGIVAKAAAIGAAKGAIIGGIKGAAIGAGVGLAVKGAAALVAKKALLTILLKAAALKGAALLAVKKAAVKGVGGLALKGLNGIMSANEVFSALVSSTNAISAARSNCPPAVYRSPLMQILSGTARAVQNTLRPCEAAQEKTPVIYRIVSAPRIVAVPV